MTSTSAARGKNIKGSGVTSPRLAGEREATFRPVMSAIVVLPPPKTLAAGLQTPEIPRVIRKAFLPGAGLGTRLRPLTDLLPKPLVPLFHRPLIEWAMVSCRAAGITDFAINTHHLPERWQILLRQGFGGQVVDLSSEASAKEDGGPVLRSFSEGGWEMKGEGMAGGNGLPSIEGSWQGLPLHLFHEPLLLETGGGVKNIEAWAAGESVLVHNGDIFSSLPLDRLVAAHEASGLPVTLALRSDGVAKHIALDGDRAIDIRGMLGRAEGTHVFSGIYCFDPELFGLIPAGEKVSVIPAFLELAKQGRLGAVVLDEGDWRDLGDPASYLTAHQELALGPEIHPDAVIDPTATVERSIIGPRAEIGAGAVVRDAVVWPGAKAKAGEVVECRVLTV